MSTTSTPTPQPVNLLRIYTSPDYIGEPDLDGRELTVRIVGAEIVKQLKASPADKPKDRVVLTLAAKNGSTLGKRLILNKTNARVLGKAFGKYSSDWAGRWITLKPTTCSAFGEQNVPCIRVAVSSEPNS